MKNISISFSENRETPNKDHIINDGLLQYILSIVATEYQYINFVWICSSEYNRIPFFKRVNLYQKRIARTKGATIHNTIRLTNRFPDKRLKNFCAKNKFALEVEFDNNVQLSKALTNTKNKCKVDIISVINTRNANLTEVYSLAKKYCFHLRIKQNFIYSQQLDQLETEEYLIRLKELFDYWLQDKEGIFLKPFVDHIRNEYKIAVEKECINSSCLGRTLHIDSSGEIYLCVQAQENNFKLGNIKNFSSISEVFQTDNFIKLVKSMIEMRKNCMTNCSHFNFCQGGCCTCTNICGLCSAYCEIVKGLNEYISNSVQDIIINGRSLGNFNPVLSIIVKEIISYNPATLTAAKTVPK